MASSVNYDFVYGACKLADPSCPDARRDDCHTFIQLLTQPGNFSTTCAALVTAATKAIVAGATEGKQRFLAGLAPAMPAWFEPDEDLDDRVFTEAVRQWICTASPQAVLAVVKESTDLRARLRLLDEQLAEAEQARHNLAGMLEGIPPDMDAIDATALIAKLRGDVDACAGVAAAQTAKCVELENALADARAEKQELIGFISATDEFKHRHPEEVLTWWDTLRASQREQDQQIDAETIEDERAAQEAGDAT